jgi:hypothetical protein
MDQKCKQILVQGLVGKKILRDSSASCFLFFLMCLYQTNIETNQLHFVSD